MTWSRTQTRFIAATPEALFDALSTPSLWPAFNDDVQSFEVVGAPALTGPGGPQRLALGDEVRVLPHTRVFGAVHGLTAPPARITALVTDRELEWTQDQPGGSTVQRWSLEPRGTGTLLTRSTVTTGPLTPALGPAFGGGLSSDLGRVAARLALMVGVSDSTAASQPLVIVAGGSGYLGSRVTEELLARGRDVVVLTRSLRAGLPYRQAVWDGRTQGSWAELFSDPRGVDVVNLTGYRIGDAGGAATMARMTDSRVNPTRALVTAALNAGVTVKHWLQGSGGVMRANPDEPVVTESTPLDPRGEEVPGMSELIRRWEDAVADAPAESLTLMRTGIVLGRDAAAFKALRAVVSLGAGGSLAGGRQWVPWIHEDDWLSIARAALGLEGLVALPGGPVVASAPNPVTNAELMRELRARFAPGGLGIPAPKPLLKLGTGVLRKDPGVLTGSTRAVSSVLPVAGFVFGHPTLGPALDDLLG